jgi:hypothetical protein
MPKYRAYLNSAIHGPFEIGELKELPGFDLDTTVCVDGESDWMPAREFSAIVHYEKRLEVKTVIETGDEVDPSKPRKAQNWRDSIIPSNAPELKRYTPVVSKNGENPTAFPEWNDIETTTQNPSRPSLINLAKLHGAVAPRRRAILLVWGLVSFGFCYPGTEAFFRLYNVLPVQHQEAILARQGSRFRGGLISRIAFPVLHLKKVPAKVKIEKPAPAAPSNVEELNSEDLGNGYIMKTVIVTKVRGGFKTQETKSILVPKTTKRRHASR